MNNLLHPPSPRVPRRDGYYVARRSVRLERLRYPTLCVVAYLCYAILAAC